MGSDQSKSRTSTSQSQQVYQNNYGQRSSVLNSAASATRTPPARPPPPSTSNNQTQASKQTPHTTTKISFERQRNPYNYVREELPQPANHNLYPTLTLRSTDQSSQQTSVGPRTTNENLTARFVNANSQDNITARYENARAWIDNNYPCGPTNSFEVVESQFRVQPSTSYRVQPTAPPAPSSPTTQTPSASQRASAPQTSSASQRASAPQTSSASQRASAPQTSSASQRASAPQTSSASQRTSASQTFCAMKRPQRTYSPKSSSSGHMSTATQRSTSPQTLSSPNRSSSSQRSSSPNRSSSSQRSSTSRGRSNKSQYRNNNSKRNQNNNNDIRCETCNGFYGDKIFQCDMSHSSCENCKYKEIICGKCSGGITNKRNFALEEFMMANNYKIKCPNAADGCRLLFKRNEVDDHLKECPFNDLKCPMPDGSCNWHGKISQLYDHFEERHPSNKTDVDSEMEKNICYDSTSVNLIKLGAFRFLLYTKVSEIERKIYMAVQLIGTKISAAKWNYEIHIYNKREPRRKFQHSDCCRSSVESLDGIMEGKCIVLPLNYAMTFIAEGNLTFKCFIKKEFDDRNNNRGERR